MPSRSSPKRSRTCSRYESVATSTCVTSPPPGPFVPRSPSISSSAASVSFWPSRSKNFTPLYSGGLCEAEMTTPRSRRRRATAGVGTTPASTAAPPAETTPRANASSSSSPEPRVSRPTKTRPPPDHSAAALPSFSTSSGVMNSPTIPRTPSVPKYCLATGSDPSGRTAFGNGRTGASSLGGGRKKPERKGDLALGELRGLAGLVQSGLLALDLAGVAREVALALERHAELRVGLDEGPGDSVPNCAGLAGEAAAVHAHAKVVLTLEARRLERRDRDRLPDGPREVLLDRPA